MRSGFGRAVSVGLVFSLTCAGPLAYGQGTAEPTPQATGAPLGVRTSQPASEPGARALDALVDEALARNPDLLALREGATAAGERPEQARALPDPMVSLQYTNDGWQPTLGAREMTTLAVMASQTLPWPGKRSLRAAIAQQEALAPAERLERARLSVAAAVRRAYWGLALARETLRLIAEQEQVWKEAEGVARARYAVGQGAQQDVLRAQVEMTRFEQDRARQEAERDVRIAELNRLLGREPQAPAVETRPLTLEAKASELTALWAEAEAKSPELRAAAAAGERERLAAALARRDFRPDVTVQASYMNRGGLDPMWQAGLGLNLPVFRARRKAALAEAEAQGRSAARQLEAVRAQLRFRTQERLAQLRAAERMARLYAEGIVPQARLAYESAIASYQVGRVPFLSVLEALSSLYGDRLAELGVLAAHEQIQASLEEASLEATSELPSGGAASMAGGFGGGSPGSAAMGEGGSSAPAATSGMGK
jgi:cobalt-zinc-cadmium efflux system outer membrane protein